MSFPTCFVNCYRIWPWFWKNNEINSSPWNPCSLSNKTPGPDACLSHSHRAFLDHGVHGALGIGDKVWCRRCAAGKFQWSVGRWEKYGKIPLFYSKWKKVMIKTTGDVINILVTIIGNYYWLFQDVINSYQLVIRISSMKMTHLVRW